MQIKINTINFPSFHIITANVSKTITINLIQKFTLFLFAILWIAMIPSTAFSQNTLSFIGAPETIRPGNIETVKIAYQTTADSTEIPVQVRLINSLDSIIIEVTEHVSDASGNQTFSMIIPDDLPDEIYKWNTQMFNDTWTIVLATTEMEGITLNSFSEEDCDNICIGLDESFYPNEYNKLYIECTNPDKPLIEGDFENDYLKINGKVGISSGAGTTIIENIQHTHSNGDENFLKFNPKESTGKPVAISQNGRITIGTDDICWRHITENDTTSITANDTTYLIVDGAAFKYSDAYWETVSDKRLKQNIAPLKTSLNAFLDINFYSYQYKKTNKTRFGIMAQEVEKLFPHSMGKFTEGDGSEYLTFNPNNLVYTGLKATQEIGELTLAQETKIEQLVQENNYLKAELETIKTLLKNQGYNINQNNTHPNSGKESIRNLQQNKPNPFSETTTIPYFLPSNIQEAYILIYDVSGKTVEKYSLPTTKGSGNLELSLMKNNISKGIYSYSLFVDGNLIDTQKMQMQ